MVPSIVVTIVLTVPQALAHMILQNPIPYGRPTLDNSPLGLDFPCKQRIGVYNLTEMNYWKAGELKTISFVGSAVHGGGSCQFSITTDQKPSNISKWKVIHSIIGGCPSNVTDNLEPNTLDHGAATFEVRMPEEIPSGLYTFAWTWFNRRGNREMYMNCAPITVTGGAYNMTYLGKLPDMFVANLPDASCATVEDFDYAFPHPGKSVTTGKLAKIGTMLVGTDCASITKIGAGSASTNTEMEPTRVPVSQATRHRM